MLQLIKQISTWIRKTVILIDALELQFLIALLLIEAYPKKSIESSAPKKIRVPAVEVFKKRKKMTARLCTHARRARVHASLAYIHPLPPARKDQATHLRDAMSRGCPKYHSQNITIINYTARF